MAASCSSALTGITRSLLTREVSGNKSEERAYEIKLHWFLCRRAAHREERGTARKDRGSNVFNPHLFGRLSFTILLVAATPVASTAQIFTTLASFNGPNGMGPLHTSLVQATDGDLYGTTTSGGSTDGGTIYKITPAGILTTLSSFDWTRFNRVRLLWNDGPLGRVL